MSFDRIFLKQANVGISSCVTVWTFSKCAESFPLLHYMDVLWISYSDIWMRILDDKKIREKENSLFRKLVLETHGTSVMDGQEDKCFH